MIRSIVASFTLVSLVSFAAQIPARSEPMLPAVVTTSTRMPAGIFWLTDKHTGMEDAKTSGAAIVVRGDNITVDFTDLTLRGADENAAPDTRRGVGILVTGRNVTIKNATVHGFKVGLLARNAPGLRIVGGDFSDNWKQHLASTLEREDLADWMSYHQNEKNEWLRYGAAIYLDGCDGFSVTKAKATGGQCGLMLNRSNRGVVAGCNFSFLSGIGIGLYRSSENNIQQNRIDWCVRGYSHGVYNRGQDSAGILVYEQSNKNIVAYNSVTHGGDGFFLWAGQSTMDTGQGGCNDNLVYGNDFSHSPTNGIEATFSRNTFANNKVYECWHGVWGGYSFDTKIVGNRFGYNAEAIAIEHGQHNTIAHNQFERDNRAIHLWQNAQQDPTWGYPKHHDTESHGYTITKNVIDVFQTSDYGTTRDVTERDNISRKIDAYPTMLSSGAPILASETNGYAARFPTSAWNPFAAETYGIAAPKRLSGYASPFLSPTALRGRRYIVVDEWGPYDFTKPVLVAREPLLPDGKPHLCEIFGPGTNWRLKSATPGVTLSAYTGKIPGTVLVTLPATGDRAAEIEITLESIDGKKAETFGITRFLAPIHWNVAFYPWDKDKSDPRNEADAFAKQLAGTPLATLKADELNLAGYGQFAPNVPATYFATVADGVFTVPPGDYVLDITTDDGCRATLDGKPILPDAWKYQGPTLYSVPFTSTGDAPHMLHVEHFQIDGYATLKVNLRKK